MRRLALRREATRATRRRREVVSAVHGRRVPESRVHGLATRGLLALSRTWPASTPSLIDARSA
eukprot:2925755-Prorocentrum_lima.AAC.1